mmetsp:Transcript_17261/g.37780  ORF Transcript_17261/g.37780 Transcript_17261/m.37780 type:complete len:244 (+) Transcript_17261:166-897(+)
MQDKNTENMTPSSNDPAEARKRRKEIIQSQRSENESIANGATASVSNNAPVVSSATDGIEDKHDTAEDTEGDASNISTVDPSENGPDKKPPKKRKMASGDSSARKNCKKDTNCLANSKKTQIRYDPDVPMNKDQLAAWRREARRVRNRESAAASRQRIRNRISELEDEVGEWKAKYSGALQRLEALEQHITANGNRDTSGGAMADEQPPEEPHEQHPSPEQPAEQPLAASGTLTEETQDSTLV